MRSSRVSKDTGGVSGGSRLAVFLDRDGTLIEDVGFLKDVSGIDLFPETVPALRLLQERFLLFVVTNQSGIADGELTMDDVRVVNAALARRLTDAGVTISEWYVCPHNKSDGCSCRKPSPEFLLRAAEAYGVDLAASYVIGDHPHDALTGVSLGVRGLYLLTGHGRKHVGELSPGQPVFETIGEAADWIGNQSNPT